MKINLKKNCSGQTITREDGEKIYKMVRDAWPLENKIIIDFSNILVASVSFMDQAFGKLAFNFPRDELVKKLQFKNINNYDRALLNDILISRYNQKALGQNGVSKGSRSTKRRRITIRENKRSA